MSEAGDPPRVVDMLVSGAEHPDERGSRNVRCTAVTAGAWGLSAAAELSARGHRVTLVERHGIGNALSSSRGPTRLWRLAVPDPLKIRLSLRARDAMRRLERVTAATLHLRWGLLWRDTESPARLASALRAAGVPYTEGRRPTSAGSSRVWRATAATRCSRPMPEWCSPRHT
ncbi:FAD-dependent oxidoreductase [Microbispora sp. H10830]|uniref:FAD-dependent oxidoreductase n=1 Tax=Microbispora sp. H10830 TaxID=2729109 RepID=UPI001601734D|nr:FAD-dependent oxidoreductase [Microbispora sp. H10830]